MIFPGNPVWTFWQHYYGKQSFLIILSYKRIESPDSYEVIYAKALGRGKASGETISWGESIVSQVFSTHKIQYKNSTLSKFLTGWTIPSSSASRSKSQQIFFIPSFSSGLVAHHSPMKINQSLNSFHHHTKIILQKKTLLDKITNLEAEHEQIAMQEDFISTISHELLSPLGFIKGYTTTLMQVRYHLEHGKPKRISPDH